jgi:hypothetical protein
MKKRLSAVLLMVLMTVMILSVAGCKNSSGNQEQAVLGRGNNYFAVSPGWMENASGQRQKFSFETQFKAHGVTHYDIVDANYDLKKQSDRLKLLFWMVLPSCSPGPPPLNIQKPI